MYWTKWIKLLKMYKTVPLLLLKIMILYLLEIIVYLMSPAWLYPSLVLTYFPSSRSVCSLSTPSLLGNSFALLQMATSSVAMSFACFPYFCILPPFRRLHKYFNRCAGTINYPSNHTIYPQPPLLLRTENSNDCFHFYAMEDLKSVLKGTYTYCAVLDRAHFGCHWRDCQQKILAGTIMHIIPWSTGNL